MPPKRNRLGIRRQIDREIKDLDKERSRLVAARAALDGEAVVAKKKAKRFSQDDVAEYLGKHPGATYTEVAEGLGASPINVAAHLSRGQKGGRFRNSDGVWSLTNET